MPSHLRISFNDGSVEAANIYPKDAPWNFSHYTPQEERLTLVFKCSDDDSALKIFSVIDLDGWLDFEGDIEQFEEEPLIEIPDKAKVEFAAEKLDLRDSKYNDPAMIVLSHFARQKANNPCSHFEATQNGEHRSIPTYRHRLFTPRRRSHSEDEV